MGNILIEDMTHDDFIKTNAEKQKIRRLAYLKTFIKPCPNYCPECGHELTTTEDEEETICTHCGLITSMSIEYVAGQKINLPFGRH